MKAMTLREIATACSGHYYGDITKLDMEVMGVAIDSAVYTVSDLKAALVALKGGAVC